jgi:hypothetical protein
MPDGKVHATERQFKGLVKKRQRAQHDAEIPEIESAGKRLEKLEDRVKKLEGEIAMYRSRYDKMLAWCLAQGMRFDE